MTVVLTIACIVILAIAVWQISKMFELSVGGVDDSQVANDEDNKINGYLMFGFLVFIYVLTIYSLCKWGKLTLGISASEHGENYDGLMSLNLIVLFVVQVITQALLHYFAFKYRGKKSRKALHYADNDKLEMIWTIIPVIVLSALILYGLWTWTNIMNVNDEDDPMVVELYAQQFNWKVRYAGKDNVLGDANVRFLKDYEGKNVIGLDSSDPNGKDDVVVTSELHLPVGKKVVFKMRSQDVLHSAYMPFFRAQMNCVPGMITQFGLTPTITTAEMRLNPEIIEKVKLVNKLRLERASKGEDAEPWAFDYILLCNKICGSSHYNMQMKIVVETQKEFENWIAQQKTFEQEVLIPR